MRGKNNPSYIDGRSKNKRCYRGDDWEEQRKKCYKRDHYTCQVCGKHCGRKEIQAHHIIPYKEKGTNDLSNLITLCNVCHAQVEAGTIQIPLL
ncbi:MAG: HNH endonuclease [Candidatus Thorarchaeota archaeon]